MPRAQFPTTRWSVVLTAGPEGEAPRRALHQLCADYWRPLFAFLRRSGMSAVDAEDIVQGFVSSLLDGPAIAGADRERGRFRSYLLGALRNYLGHQRARATAIKRGGGRAPLPLHADEDQAIEIPDDRTPEGAYAYVWAMSILGRAEAALRQRYAASGQAALFEALRPTLLSDAPPSYAVLAEGLGMTEGAARVAAHRMRGRFGTALREEVAQTVASPADIDDELRAVIAAISA